MYICILSKHERLEVHGTMPAPQLTVFPTWSAFTILESLNDNMYVSIIIIFHYAYSMHINLYRDLYEFVPFNASFIVWLHNPQRFCRVALAQIRISKTWIHPCSAAAIATMRVSKKMRYGHIEYHIIDTNHYNIVDIILIFIDIYGYTWSSQSTNRY